MTTPIRFTDRLHHTIEAVGSPICVGLDPVFENLPPQVRAQHHEPVAAIDDFSHGVINAVAGTAAAIKFQSACYERHGSAGIAVLEHRIAHAARVGLTVILDAKRGDIGISAEHYAAAAKRAGAHAITVNAYLGIETVKPYLAAGLGVFILVRTSNPDSDAVQQTPLADSRTVAEMMADLTASLGATHLGLNGLSDVGAVVGATKSAVAAALRQRMPDQYFLIPGYGAQGGKAEDIRAMLRPPSPPSPRNTGAAGVIVTASRSIIYAGNAAGQPGEPELWTQGVNNAAVAMAQELRAILRH